jgi:non-ribosomal peptide synthetase component F
MTVTLLGILKSGGAYVALDETHPRQRLEFILGDAGAEVLVTRHALLSSLPQFPGRVVLLDADVASPADGGAGSGQFADAGRPGLRDLHIGDHRAPPRESCAPSGA